MDMPCSWVSARPRDRAHGHHDHDHHPIYDGYVSIARVQSTDKPAPGGDCEGPAAPVLPRFYHPPRPRSGSRVPRSRWTWPWLVASCRRPRARPRPGALRNHARNRPDLPHPVLLRAVRCRGPLRRRVHATHMHVADHEETGPEAGKCMFGMRLVLGARRVLSACRGVFMTRLADPDRPGVMVATAYPGQPNHGPMPLWSSPMPLKAPRPSACELAADSLTASLVTWG